MTLFWHMVFATGSSKIDNTDQMMTHINLFRRQGLGNYRHLLVELAKNPAMIYWLDNNENHKDRPNENWGRELLELFSMGQGNYTEEDVYECARAFTRLDHLQKASQVPLWTLSLALHLRRGRPRRQREELSRTGRPVQR